MYTDAPSLCWHNTAQRSASLIGRVAGICVAAPAVQSLHSVGITCFWGFVMQAGVLVSYLLLCFASQGWLLFKACVGLGTHVDNRLVSYSCVQCAQLGPTLHVSLHRLQSCNALSGETVEARTASKAVHGLLGLMNPASPIGLIAIKERVYHKQSLY